MLANEVVEMASYRHSYHCNSAYWLVFVYSKRAWSGTSCLLTTHLAAILCLLCPGCEDTRSTDTLILGFQ